MTYKVCDNCRGYIFEDDLFCKKCKYNKEHFIITFNDMVEIIKNNYDMDELLFQLGVRWQNKLTDPEIRQLADVCFESTKDLEKSNQLYMELDHMNNMVMTT